jgi:uncharacterized integral membrane protein
MRTFDEYNAAIIELERYLETTTLACEIHYKHGNWDEFDRCQQGIADAEARIKFLEQRRDKIPEKDRPAGSSNTHWHDNHQQNTQQQDNHRQNTTGSNTSSSQQQRPPDPDEAKERPPEPDKAKEASPKSEYEKMCEKREEEDHKGRMAMAWVAWVIATILYMIFAYNLIASNDAVAMGNFWWLLFGAPIALIGIASHMSDIVEFYEYIADYF